MLVAIAQIKPRRAQEVPRGRVRFGPGSEGCFVRSSTAAKVSPAEIEWTVMAGCGKSPHAARGSRIPPACGSVPDPKQQDADLAWLGKLPALREQ